MPKRKVCYIPTCSNTSANSNKLFLRVPNDLKIRKTWWEVAKIQTAAFRGHEVYCCEDHFNVEEDTQNWMYFKTIGSVLKLKPGILPHKFIDNPPSISLDSLLSGSVEKRKLDVLRNLESNTATQKKKIRRFDQASTSTSHVVPNIFTEEPDTELANTQPMTSSCVEFEVILCRIKPDVPFLTRDVAVQVSLKGKKMRSVQTNTEKGVICDNVPSVTEKTLAITSSESMTSVDSEYLPSSSSVEFIKIESFEDR